jgi:hypothetical protein
LLKEKKTNSILLTDNQNHSDEKEGSELPVGSSGEIESNPKEELEKERHKRQIADQIVSGITRAQKHHSNEQSRI